MERAVYCNFILIATLYSLQAIVKAISRVRRLDMKEAEEIFTRGVVLSKTEKDELEKEIRKEAEKQAVGPDGESEEVST